MTHNVCTGGCGGASEAEGVCQVEGCSKHNQPLTACNCEDSLHAEVLKKSEGEETPEGSTEESAGGEASSE